MNPGKIKNRNAKIAIFFLVVFLLLSVSLTFLNVLHGNCCVEHCSICALISQIENTVKALAVIGLMLSLFILAVCIFTIMTSSTALSARTSLVNLKVKLSN